MILAPNTVIQASTLSVDFMVRATLHDAGYKWSSGKDLKTHSNWNSEFHALLVDKKKKVVMWEYTWYYEDKCFAIIDGKQFVRDNFNADTKALMEGSEEYVNSVLIRYGMNPEEVAQSGREFLQSLLAK